MRRPPTVLETTRPGGIVVTGTPTQTRVISPGPTLVSSTPPVLTPPLVGAPPQSTPAQGTITGQRILLNIISPGY